MSTLDIVDAVARQSALPGNVALSEGQHHNRVLEARNDSMTSLNDQLRTMAESLMSADRRKDEFLAVLAHELRGPLSAMKMASSVLALGTSDQDKAVHLGNLIDRQTAHMSRIVEDLIDVSRIGRNEVSIERSQVDLSDVVQQL